MFPRRLSLPTFACAILLVAAPLRSQTPRNFKFTPPDEKILKDAGELDRQFEKKGLILEDPKAEEYLERIGEGLLGGAPPPERVAYRFRILRDPMVNAFSLANGSIYVNTGLVAVLENEAELASILGHEITHVADRHEYRLNRSVRKKAVTMEVIAAAAGAAGYFPAGVIFGSTVAVAGNVSQVILVSAIYGYSQDLERDADLGGYGRLIHANYDGTAMKRSLQLLDEKLEFEPTQPFWRTHPKLEERIAAAEQLAKTENRDHPRAVTESGYLEHMASAIRENEELDLDSRRTRTAVARAQRLVNWQPDNAAYRTLLADAYRSLGAKTTKPAENELTEHGKAAARKRMLQMTADEEQKKLLAARTGPATLASNRAEAESQYRQAIASDPSFPGAHRGLGMLYQDEGKDADAVHEYQIYLQMAPAALDRLRISRRIESLTAAPGSGK